MSNLLVNFNHLLNYRSREYLSGMDNQARRTLLLELLLLSPGETTWRALCELFAAWPEGGEKAAALALADTALQTWDDRLRHRSSSWRYLYDGDKLASLALLVRSIQLYRREQTGNRELGSILRSELARNLRYLTIFKSELSQAVIARLADSPHLSNLHSLEIKSTVLLDEDVEHLFQGKGLVNLKVLKLIKVGFIRDNTIRSLATAPYFCSLELLDLSGNSVTDVGIQMLWSITNEQGINLVMS